MRTARVVKLSESQCRLLLSLIHIMEAGDWTQGDYCLTQSQFDALKRAELALEYATRKNRK